MLNIDFPFSFDGSGQTATTSDDDHKLDMLFQLLLTYPHERVNRPDFGTPLSQICFEGNAPEMAEVVQFIAKAGLQRWLGTVIELIDLNATAEDSTLLIDLKYRIRGDNEIRQDQRRVQLQGGSF